MVKDFLSEDKKIYDPIHGFIRFDHYEKELINSYPFQRLHHIHQLGIAYLAYPGATHSRFEHSLGVLELSTRIYEKICKMVRPDIFSYIPRKGSPEYLYWKRVLRLAALCHDLGHLPFSHVAENVLLSDLGHEYWTAKIIRSDLFMPLWKKIQSRPDFYPGELNRDFVEDIVKIAIGEKKYQQFTNQSFTPWERIITECICGDFFGADRIDYLLRDAKSTGVAYGMFDYQQLIEMLRILPKTEDKEDFSLGIDENGIESCEALLLARHFMHRRVYQYSKVKAYNFHLKRFMLKTYQKTLFDHLDYFLSMSDAEVISEIRKAAMDSTHIAHADAKSILFKEDRFKVLPLFSSLSEKDLYSLKKQHKIPDSSIDWEIHPTENMKKGWSFPVSRKYLFIQSAKDCSDLLTQMPPSKKNWVYVDPKFEVLVLQSFENWQR